jgi:hypothetical protein
VLWTLIYTILDATVGTTLRAIPAATIPDTGTWGNGYEIAGFVNQVDYLVPIRAPLYWLISAAVVAVPLLLTYRIGLWVYNRVRG